jgi:anti-sigma factor RsiW
MSCERLRSLWETFLDGELPSRQMLELQTHLDGCAECSEGVAFSQAIRLSARAVVYDEVVVSDDLRERLHGALLAEARREHDEVTRGPEHERFRHVSKLGLLTALAAAAAVLLFMGLDTAMPPRTGALTERITTVPTTTAGLGPQELLDLFIDYHTAPPAPEVTEAKLVPELERDVGVRVPLPSLAAYGAEWQGGSLLRVPRMQPAAYLRYRTRDAHRVTVYVYNASRIPLHASLERRIVREEPVYEGSWRGYSIAAQLRHGVGYAVATDLDEARSAELVRAITASVVSH